MIRILLRYMLALGCAALLVACASSPTSNYYLLTTDSLPSASAGMPPQDTLPSLGVGPISIPLYLQRDNLVYHREDNQVHIAAYHKWAEPLEDGIARVLTLNLAQGLASQNVRRFPWHMSQAPEYAVSIDVLDLDTRAGQANMTVEWLLYRPQTGASVVRRVSRGQTDLEDRTSPLQGIPAAYSELLATLSAIIAGEIRSASAAAGASP